MTCTSLNDPKNPQAFLRNLRNNLKELDSMIEMNFNSVRKTSDSSYYKSSLKNDRKSLIISPKKVIIEEEI